MRSCGCDHRPEARNPEPHGPSRGWSRGNSVTPSESRPEGERSEGGAPQANRRVLTGGPTARIRGGPRGGRKAPIWRGLCHLCAPETRGILCLNMVTNILLGAVLLLLVAFGLAAWRAYRAVLTEYLAAKDEYSAAKAEFLTFVTPAGDGQPSPLARFVEAASSTVARAVVAQAKTTMMGLSSGVVRGEKAIEGAIAEDLADQNPLGAAVLSSFPHLRKSLRRNPGLIDLALPLLANLGGGGKAESGNGSRPRFKLGG